MDTIKSYDNLEGKGTLLDTSTYKIIVIGCGAHVSTNRANENVHLTNIQCMLTTKSEEDGINCTSLKYEKMNGFLSFPYKQA